MTFTLNSQLKQFLKPQLCFDQKTYDDFQKRINEGDFTRDENPVSHICTFFLPFCSKVNKVFLIHHKKSGLWISPGGHIDKGENLFQTVSREVKEELGLEINSLSPPFMFSIVKTRNLSYSCRIHHDVWFLININNKDIQTVNEEFLDARWLSMNEAEKITDDAATIKALKRLKKIHK